MRFVLDFLDFGFKFKCLGPAVNGMRVIGQVVNGLDAIADQYGAGLSVPARFINRSNVKIIQ